MVRKPSAKHATIRRRRTVDSQCIVIEKHNETDNDATYRFVADIWEPDPEIRGRSRIAGQTAGLLRIIKSSGDVLLDQPMPEDTNDRRFSRAARKIKQHWDRNEYPEKTMFACG